MKVRRPLPIARSPLKRSTKPIRKRSRSKAEFTRIYGSKARVEFVKSLPCSACGVVGYSENAHLLGNGGMGRKGDYITIGPLCRGRNEIVIGCHASFDREPWHFHDAHPDFNPEIVAYETEKAWASSVLEDTK